jgi:hypothetical protein
MSFGLLKHFKDQKKHSAEIKQIPHAKHVIIGHDLSAVLKLLELKKQHPDESVRMISNRPLDKKALQENYEYGVSQLRSP